MWKTMRLHQINLTSYVLLITALLLLSACGEGKWEKLSDSELAEKSGECMSIPEKSISRTQVCANVERECVRRRDNNIYAC